MDFIDQLIYTANTANVRGAFPALPSDFIGGIPQAGLPALANAGASYPRQFREDFVFFQDPNVIDRSIQKHWFDMTNGPINLFNLFAPVDPPPYHLIYAYLLENSRLSQIMERLIYMYQHDEILGIASPGNVINENAFQWISNTENLFFKTLSNTSYRNIAGNLRPNPEASRRNAYYRLFGMDLAFGDPAGGSSNTDYSYHKAKTANQQFIVLFEQFLTEIWQAYMNAQNTSGANTTDYQKIRDMAIKLREMLMARRGGLGTISLANYRFMNLSKEEYSTVGLLSWLFFVISYNSPLVTFLGCQANTASERLTNIGKKVGIEAHKKSQALFDMAGPMGTVLRQIEFGTFETVGAVAWIRGVIEAETPLGRPPVATVQQVAALGDLLTIINNWEKATGHKIKHPEANITGTVSVRSNGVSSNGVKAKPVMN